MPAFSLPLPSIAFLVLSVLVSAGTYWFARAHVVHLERLSSGQTMSLVKRIARLPAADRLEELRRIAAPETIEWRIADDALQAETAQRAFVVDSVLADVALELDARTMWPRAAVRLSGAAGVFLMAIALSFHLEVFVAIVLLLMGIASAIACMTLQRRALSISTEIRRGIDALIDVLDLRSAAPLRSRHARSPRFEPRSRRR